MIKKVAKAPVKKPAKTAKVAARQQALLPATDLADDAVDMGVEQMNQIVAQMDKIIATGNATDVARAFVRMRDFSERMEELQKPFYAYYELVKNVKLPEVFERAGVPTVNLDEARVTVAMSMRASVRKDMKQEAIEWLTANGLGDLVAPSINASTLSAAAKHMAEENKELPDHIFNCAIMPTTSVTKTKAKTK